jgi:hypothetical protein
MQLLLRITERFKIDFYRVDIKDIKLKIAGRQFDRELRIIVPGPVRNLSITSNFTGII